MHETEGWGRTDRCYGRQGESQPFGYTGYRYDDVSGTYFAQAREYEAGIGRFIAEDVVRGNRAVPITLNRYGYCWENPIMYIDKNGMEPEKEYTFEIMDDINGIGLMWDQTGVKGTILMGSDATIDDAYAIIALDYLNDQGCDEQTINEFIDNYRESKNNDTLIAKEKGIEYYTNFEDITEKLTYQMIKNEYEYGDKYAVVTWVANLMEFKENVQNGGPWDLKQLDEWNNSSLYIFDGEIVDRDAPGNIMYGYMGHTYGIPDSVLYYAASTAQILAGTSKVAWIATFPNCTMGDDPRDQYNIKRGIDYWLKLHKKLDGKEMGVECE